MLLVRRYLNGKCLSTTATTVMEQSWGSGTRKQYATYLQKWRHYCSPRGIDPICPSVDDGINFLDSDIGYSAINTARSAVSSIVTLSNNFSFGTHPMVCCFLKGVFELKPSLPKYMNIWDVNIVLTYLSSLLLPQDLTLKDLTYKTTMLLALLSGQRCQTLHLLSVRGMVLKHDSCVFTIHKLLKTSRSGKHVSALTFTAYSPDSCLCPIVCLSEYVKRTSELRKGSDQLLVSFQKPYQPVLTDTICQWLKTVLAKSGIDTSAFTGQPQGSFYICSCGVQGSFVYYHGQCRLEPGTQPLGNSTRNPLSQQVKLMDNSCWKTSAHRIVTDLFLFSL